MKKVFFIYRFSELEVCVPSQDYYSRSGDWSTESSNSLICVSDSFDSEKEAEEYLLSDEFLESVYELDKASFVILPTYIKK